MRGVSMNELRGDMMRMRREGMSNGEIAEALNCCIDVVIKNIGRTNQRRTTPAGYYIGRYRVEWTGGKARAKRVDTPRENADETPRIMVEEQPKPAYQRLKNVWVLFPGGDTKWVFNDAYYVRDGEFYIIFRTEDNEELARFNSRSVLGVLRREGK